MKKSVERKGKMFKGAGYLIGFAAGAVVAVLFVVLTGVEALIGAIAGAVSFPLGMVLEKRFQNSREETDDKGTSVPFTFLLVGILMLGIIFFLIH
jgi:hypothetical protein